jgi:hypothetical protein
MRRLRQERAQHGAVALLVALALIVLVGVAGIVIDLGRLFVIKTELQNAADACALAAARELNVPSKTLSVLTRAENAGIEVGNRHFDDFQHNQVVFRTDHDVTFSTALDGTYVTKASAAGSDVRYVRCTHEVKGIIPTLTSILGVGSNDVAATAVASLQGGMTTCPIPLAMCKQNAPVPPCTVPNTEPDRFGLCVGQWYAGLMNSKSTEFASGNFNWVDFTPHAGGTSDIADALIGSGVCDVDPSVKVLHADAGQKEGVAKAWNSRFGLYKGGGPIDPESGPPDLTGYAYGEKNWPQQQLAYSDYRARQGDHTPYPGDGVTGLKTNGYHASSRDEHRAGTSDRRILPMPVVDCSTWGPKHQADIAGWACALMVYTMPAPNSKTNPDFEELRLEYLGDAAVEGSPCASYGQSGGPGGPGPKVPTLVQ